MQKRGSTEVTVFVFVLIIAALGLYFVMTPYAGKATAMPDAFVSCEQNCYEQFTGESLSSCLGGCITLTTPQIKETYTATPTGRVLYNPDYPVYYPGAETPMAACQRMCDMNYVGPIHERCRADCYQYSSIENTYTRYTQQPLIAGQFAMPTAKEYGGDISGVADGAMRAFPGRAIEISDASCFTCSCMDEGITASDADAAARVCHENCGGVLTSEVQGECQ